MARDLNKYKTEDEVAQWDAADHPGEKWCGGMHGCAEWHPVEDFRPTTKGRDGLDNLCRISAAARERARKAAIKAGTHVPNVMPWKGRDFARFSNAENLKFWLALAVPEVGSNGDPSAPCLIWPTKWTRKDGYPNTAQITSGGATLNKIPYVFAKFWALDGVWPEADQQTCHLCNKSWPGDRRTPHACIEPAHLMYDSARQNGLTVALDAHYINQHLGLEGDVLVLQREVVMLRAALEQRRDPPEREWGYLW